MQFVWPLGMPLVRKMSADLWEWEIRSRVEHGIARIFFTVVEQDIVLLHGFKKSQRTLKNELTTATQRMKDVQNATSKEASRK